MGTTITKNSKRDEAKAQKLPWINLRRRLTGVLSLHFSLYHQYGAFVYAHKKPKSFQLRNCESEMQPHTHFPFLSGTSELIKSFKFRGSAQRVNTSILGYPEVKNAFSSVLSRPFYYFFLHIFGVLLKISKQNIFFSRMRNHNVEVFFWCFLYNIF